MNEQTWQHLKLKSLIDIFLKKEKNLQAFRLFDSKFFLSRNKLNGIINLKLFLYLWKSKGNWKCEPNTIKSPFIFSFSQGKHTLNFPSSIRFYQMNKYVIMNFIWYSC